MKKAILLCGMLLALTASVTYAAGVNMRWNACFGEGGATNRNSTCASNILGQSLFCSFEIDAPLNAMIGDVMVIDLASASPTLPAWWTFVDPASCRPSSLSIAASDGTVSCIDWSVLQASMNIAAYDVAAHGPNTARIKCLNAVQSTGIQDLVANFEYGVVKLTVNNARTVNSTCTGCADPVCIVMNSVFLDTESGAGGVFLGSGTAAGSNIVTWQGAGADCQAVPVRNASWGQVKALYR